MSRRDVPFNGNYTTPRAVDRWQETASCGCLAAISVVHRPPCPHGRDTPPPPVAGRWELPPSPPAAVTAVRAEPGGELWRRTLADTWTNGVMVWAWRTLLTEAAALVDATEHNPPPAGGGNPNTGGRP